VTISVFTPSHRPRFLTECYRSLAAQTHTDWEWIVLLNSGANWNAPDDPRVRVLRERTTRLVGAVKRAACAEATGDILLELDHDDVLASTCLADVDAAFKAQRDTVLVYSDFAQINEDGTRNDDRFDESMGWEYDDVGVDGGTYLQCHALAPTPHNVSYIWYAPNHVRAFRRDAYEQVGGYDPDLEVLDDQDLMMRLYEAGDFSLIPKCLYLQRMHARNTQKNARINADIQEQTVARYESGFPRLAAAWSRRKGLDVVTIGTPRWPTTADDDPGEQVIIDPGDPRLPFADSSVGVIKAVEVLQRIPDRAAFFSECYRVLAHGGALLTLTPSTDGRGASQDPSHVAFYNENSFWYLTQQRLRDLSMPELSHTRFQIGGIRTYYPTQFDQDNHILYVRANLLALKEGPRQGGPLLC
jgi:SAM-dependent methyltransferase